MITLLNSASQQIYNSSLKNKANIMSVRSFHTPSGFPSGSDWQKVTLYNETYVIGTFDAGDICGLTLLTIWSPNCAGTLVTCWDNIKFGILHFTQELLVMFAWLKSHSIESFQH